MPVNGYPYSGDKTGSIKPLPGHLSEEFHPYLSSLNVLRSANERNLLESPSISLLETLDYQKMYCFLL
jgi:hypothetical protein